MLVNSWMAFALYIVVAVVRLVGDRRIEKTIVQLGGTTGSV